MAVAEDMSEKVITHSCTDSGLTSSDFKGVVVNSSSILVGFTNYIKQNRAQKAHPSFHDLVKNLMYMYYFFTIKIT